MKIRKEIVECIVAVILSSVICSCTSKPDEIKKEEETFNFDASKVSNYLAITDSINSNGYVPYFRMFKSTNLDFENWNINADESKFLTDSIAYYNSRKLFFNQEKDFLYWLLSFKNDTLFDSNELQSTLWMPFTNPYSSSISACLNSATKSRQAINLIYGFLNGLVIKCIECPIENNNCTKLKYEYVETFLIEHRNATIQQLRDAWKPN